MILAAGSPAPSGPASRRRSARAATPTRSSPLSCCRASRCSSSIILSPGRCAIRWASTSRNPSSSARPPCSARSFPARAPTPRSVMGLVVDRARLPLHAAQHPRLPPLVGGLSPQAARYAGFSKARSVWIGLLVGGACAGLAGVGEVAGPLGMLQRILSPGYGFAAIIVAFLGGLHPIGIVFAALVMALIYVGGDFALVSAGVPNASVTIFQGLLLVFYLASAILFGYRVRLGRHGGSLEAARHDRHARLHPRRHAGGGDADALRRHGRGGGRARRACSTSASRA